MVRTHVNLESLHYRFALALEVVDGNYCYSELYVEEIMAQAWLKAGGMRRAVGAMIETTTAYLQ